MPKGQSIWDLTAAQRVLLLNMVPTDEDEGDGSKSRSANGKTPPRILSMEEMVAMTKRSKEQQELARQNQEGEPHQDD